MNIARVLPVLNGCLWIAQATTSAFYAHSLGLALLGVFGFVIAAIQWHLEPT